MKSILIALALSTFASSVSNAQMFNKKTDQRAGETDYVVVPEDLKVKIPEIKKKTRVSINPYRYDASKTTYYVYKTFEQAKEIEVFFFSSNEYKMVFCGDAVADPIKVEIYDKPKNFVDRTLLFSKDGVAAGEFELTSTELLNKLRELKIEGGMTEAEANTLKLKKVFVNYIIPSKDKQVDKGDQGQTVITKTKGAVIMAMGYKNI